MARILAVLLCVVAFDSVTLAEVEVYTSEYLEDHIGLMDYSGMQEIHRCAEAAWEDTARRMRLCVVVVHDMDGMNCAEYAEVVRLRKKKELSGRSGMGDSLSMVLLIQVVDGVLWDWNFAGTWGSHSRSAYIKGLEVTKSLRVRFSFAKLPKLPVRNLVLYMAKETAWFLCEVDAAMLPLRENDLQDERISDAVEQIGLNGDRNTGTTVFLIVLGIACVAMVIMTSNLRRGFAELEKENDHPAPISL